MRRLSGGGFFQALAFLCRLGKAAVSPSGYSPALLWYGPVGALLGLFCTAGACLASLPFVAESQERDLPPCLAATACALLWLSLELWISRAMHWDGLADLGDALGSSAEGQKFVKILKDSRLGTFGALFLFMGLLWQWFFLSLIFYRALPLAGPGKATLLLLPVLACAWSRISPLWLAARGEASGTSFLGRMLCAAHTPRIFRLGCLQGLLCILGALPCGMSIWGAFLLILLQALLALRLGRLAKRHGGLSGDYFGAAIEASQLLFLACACAF